MSTIPDEYKRQQVLYKAAYEKDLLNKDDQTHRLNMAILECTQKAREEGKHAFESPEDVMHRAEQVKQIMAQEIKTLEGDQKVALITHSNMIMALTANGVDYENNRGFDGGTSSANCQMLAYNIEPPQED